MTTINRYADIGVAIVAPGGYAPDEKALARAVERLRVLGCRVHDYYEPLKKHQRFGGTDESRVEQLHAAARNPDVRIVLALRGGYGMSRILPALDLALLAGSGKLFVGHSDFTALQMALLAKERTISFAGPMICDDFTCEAPSEFTHAHFWNCVTGPAHTICFEGDGNPPIDVSGMLWGGNLTMLAHLAGTAYMPKVDDGILFIEDVNEHPYRVERMLLQLLHAGLLDQKAVVLGDFSAYRLSDYDNGYDFAAMLDYLRGRLGVPVLTGLPFGHMRDKATLAVGCRAHLQCDGKTTTLSMSGYPSLPGAG